MRKTLRLTIFNIQRMFLTAMMIAHKFLDEPVYSNKQWRLVGDLHMRWTLLRRLQCLPRRYACQAAFGGLDASLSEPLAGPDFPPSPLDVLAKS